MIIENNVLKCNSQCSRLIYVLAILMKLLRYVMSLMMTLRCLHNNSSSSRVKISLYFVIELLNSSTEKGVQIVVVLDWVLSNILWLIWWLCAELKNKWRAYHRSLSSIHSCVKTMRSRLCFFLFSFSFLFSFLFIFTFSIFKNSGVRVRSNWSHQSPLMMWSQH